MLLKDPLDKHFKRIGTEQKKALGRLGIATIEDLLYYFPTRYSDISELHHISELVDGDMATIMGEIKFLGTKKSFKTKVPMGEMVVEDTTGKIKVVWFHQAYLAKMHKVGEYVKISGKVTVKDSYKNITNPNIEKISHLPIERHDTLFVGDEKRSSDIRYPVYKETKGITSRWLYHAVNKIISSGALDDSQDYLPKEILTKYNLPTLSTALVWIHTPKKEEHAMAARKRFAFEEVFFIQLGRQLERKKIEEEKSIVINTEDQILKKFDDNQDFTPTKAQAKVVKEIMKNFQSGTPMHRLVEGDVGSGKTYVAAATSYMAINTRPEGQDFGTLQVAYMAPTEILATQLFENFINYFPEKNIQIGLITGKTCRKYPSKVYSQKENWTNISKNQLLKWVANGEIPVLIGTHALIQKNVKFKNLAYVIVDEQHRFGTNQRLKLARKDGKTAHYLSMTATPIPRTLALTIYGDLDLSVLDELPSGRKKVITKTVSENSREKIYEEIKKGLDEGRQLYVICPRIQDPDKEKENALNLKSVVSEAKRLKENIFTDYEIDVLHSKLTKEKKEKVMDKFYKGQTDILVSTSVVEVGVNVPNATMIIIEGAERFGLAQLHQLRGRVQRSSYQPYCYLFADAKSDNTTDRLKVFAENADGFALAEFDLAQRGAGELGGDKQWGVTDIGMEAIKNIKMVEAARDEAKKIIFEETLEKYPEIKTQLQSEKYKIHFE
ncbi:ATP-dependent DNA helicase RecG [Candidatus Nomurabacteria bacterium]|nr:ATP-dependent DNA helicase RecG [Candidatus Nomurabacteria bacterium]